MYIYTFNIELCTQTFLLFTFKVKMKGSTPMYQHKTYVTSFDYTNKILLNFS